MNIWAKWLRTHKPWVHLYELPAMYRHSYQFHTSSLWNHEPSSIPSGMSTSGAKWLTYTTTQTQYHSITVEDVGIICSQLGRLNYRRYSLNTWCPTQNKRPLFCSVGIYTLSLQTTEWVKKYYFLFTCLVSSNLDCASSCNHNIHT